MKTERITLTIPANVLEQLKQAAAAEKRSLSNYVALILSEAMENKGGEKLWELNKR